mmetsp:Transcript_20366/g.38472  ORF Transcript_20366/g.38472 Transcript_20366/m.38472 type:complete len:583 (-) Transcript_20366:41-1789(-)
MLAMSTTKIMATAAFVLLGRTQYYYSSVVTSFRFAHHPAHTNRLHYTPIIRCRQFSLTAIKSADEEEFTLTGSSKVNTKNSNNLSPQIFVDEVTSFLDTDDISWRHFSHQELRRALELYFEPIPQKLSSSSRVNEMMAMLEDRVILAVGKGARNSSSIDNFSHNNKTDCDNIEDSNHIQQPYSFILSLCPTPNLAAIQSIHQNHKPNSSVSEAVASYAWLNAHLTDAFFNHDPNNLHSTSGDKATKPMTSIVHLHQDVWNRSPKIVRSRLSSKCGRFDRRIYARQTIVKKIPKTSYLPFLEENHLWGATGAKGGYGLFLKPKKKHPKQQNHGCGTTQCDDDGDGMLVAVATFSSKRKINRASHNFHSFELLRFCTKLDTTVVGGLGKLVSAFVKGVTCNKQQNGKRGANPNGNSEEDQVEIDLITSIDRDFGSNTWPDAWQQMEVMNPVPMFVGDVDGLRRHAVGAGLTPLEQTGDKTLMSTSMVLRAGLPDSLLCQLEQESSQEVTDKDRPWQMAAKHGLYPVFDTGVERLMLVVDNEKTKHLSLPELWKNSVPTYVKKHYSSNTGIDNMLSCIRHARDTD